MPAADSIVPIIVAVSGALGLADLIRAVVVRKKTSAEAQAAAAGAVKSRADAADTITGAAAKLVEQQDERIGRLEQRDRQNTERIAHLEDRDRRRDQLAARHGSWDRQVTDRIQDLLDLLTDLLAGRTVTPARIRQVEQALGDPPPLYLPPD